MVEKAAKGRKTKSAGRFGARYGRKVRKLVVDIEEQMRKKHLCPKCGRMSVIRKGTGIWQCRKCKVIFAGGTYLPYTSIGKTVIRSIKKEAGGEAAEEIEGIEDIEGEKAGEIEGEKETKGPKK